MAIARDKRRTPVTRNEFCPDSISNYNETVLKDVISDGEIQMVLDYANTSEGDYQGSQSVEAAEETEAEAEGGETAEVTAEEVEAMLQGQWTIKDENYIIFDKGDMNLLFEGDPAVTRTYTVDMASRRL